MISFESDKRWFWGALHIPAGSLVLLGVFISFRHWIGWVFMVIGVLLQYFVKETETKA